MANEKNSKPFYARSQFIKRGQQWSNDKQPDGRIQNVEKISKWIAFGKYIKHTTNQQTVMDPLLFNKK